MNTRDERYRCCFSGTPYGGNIHRMPSQDFNAALGQAQHGIQGHSCMNCQSAPRTPSAVPMNCPPRYEGALSHSGNGANNTLDLVRKTNLAVSLANHNVNPRSQVSIIHPMMCSDGTFPLDFQTPKTIESIKLLDSMQIDRILRDYSIPYDMHSLLRILASSGIRAYPDTVSSARLRQAKLQLLFERLGATRVIEEGGFKKTSY